MARLICRAAAAAGCKDEVHSAAMVPEPCVCLHVPHCVRLQPTWMELPAQTDSDIPCSTMHQSLLNRKFVLLQQLFCNHCDVTFTI